MKEAEVRLCQWDDLYPACLPLMKSHFYELGLRGQFDVADELIRAIGNMGNLVCVGAWSGSSLVGYLCFCLSPSFASKSTLLATQSAWFVKPEHRGSSLGRELMTTALGVLRRRGVQQVFLHFWNMGGTHDIVMDRLMRSFGGTLRQSAYEIWID